MNGAKRVRRKRRGEKRAQWRMTVNYSSSFWRFLYEKQQKSAIARMLVHANEQPGYMAYALMVTTELINFITMRPSGLLSYLPAGKEHKLNEDGGWSREGRQEGRPAKVIRKLFTEKALRIIKPQDFEQFGNAYKARFMDNGFRFELWDRTRIQEAYNLDLAEGGGRLPDSCMNGDGYMEIYERCKNANILVMLNSDDRLAGRALVWKDIVTTKSKTLTFMDRLYTAEDYMDDMFLDYAAEQGWYRKAEYDSYGDKNKWVSPDGETEWHTVILKTPTNCDYYPYIDTFSYGGDGFLTNVHNSDCYYEYDCTGGGRGGEEPEPEEDTAYDEIHDEHIDQNDAVYVSDHDERRYRGRITHYDHTRQAYVSGRTTECFYCESDNIVEVNGRWYWKGHNDIIQLHDGDYALLDDTTTDEETGETYLTDDLVMVEPSGNYYRPESDLIVEIDNTWFLKEDCVEIHDVWYHKDNENIIQIGEKWYTKDDEAICYVENKCKTMTGWYLKYRPVDDRNYTGNDWVDAHPVQELHGKWYFKDDDRLVFIAGKFYHKRKDRKKLSCICGFWSLRGSLKFARKHKQLQLN